jgi:integrase
MKLTAASVRNLALPTDQNDKVFFDDDLPGFGVRLRSTGSKTFTYYYKRGGKTRRFTIGAVDAMDLVKARNTAKDLAADVRKGHDPLTERKQKIVQTDQTFKKLVDRYLEFKAGEVRARSLVEIKRHLEKHAKPLHSSPLYAVDKTAIADRLSTIAKNSGTIAANRMRSTLSAMFAWAMREGLATGNPVINTNKREEQSRDRVLTPDELRIIWNAAGDDHHGVIIKVLMLTGQRRSEIGDLRWDEIDFDGKLISLAGDRTKNDTAHTIPMSDTVHDLLKAQERKDGRPFVFGYRDNPIGGWSKSKRALDKATGKMQHWTLHDLRRTTATGMADIGIQPHIIEAVLNHQSGHKGGIAGIYNRALYTAEKADALTRWADHIAAVVAGRPSNVIKKRA